MHLTAVEVPNIKVQFSKKYLGHPAIHFVRSHIRALRLLILGGTPGGQVVQLAKDLEKAVYRAEEQAHGKKPAKMDPPFKM